MKIFRRLLFFVIFAAMAVGLFAGLHSYPNIPHERYGHVCFFLEWIGAPISMLLWCMLSLKAEAELAQVGLLLTIFYVIASVQIAMPN
ncbi:MAG TPA: hypothetical protein VHY09_00575 [Candidatus Methylacidiphilales bacterium]|jgi:hypothetical protein|nr:hypothetical protein [Candidatus Methylacidiphilales bacterium]